jgi:anti-sigma factor RsiW
MNCRAIEPLLLAERDGVLTPGQHAALAQHVAACPACRQERLIYGEAVTFLKTDAANVPVPNIDTEWRAVRAQLNAAKPAKKPRLAPVIWFGAPLAAAAALALTFFVSRPTPTVAPEEAPATIAYVDSDSGWLVVWAADADAKTSG